MKKKRPIKNTWYDLSNNYIPEPIRKTVGGFKDKVVSLLKQTDLWITGNKPCMGVEKNQANQK